MRVKEISLYQGIYLDANVFCEAEAACHSDDLNADDISSKYGNAGAKRRPEVIIRANRVMPKLTLDHQRYRRKYMSIPHDRKYQTANIAWRNAGD